MLERLKNRERGFTLIEIVLVLAIAGLILLIVFLAVSGAEKARRDTQRKQDAGRMSSEIENYAGNTNGQIPTTLAQIQSVIGAGSSYFNTTTNPDPSGATYTVTFTTNAPTAAGGVSYSNNAVCPSSGATATARNYELQVYLEQGGSYCVDNH